MNKLFLLLLVFCIQMVQARDIDQKAFYLPNTDIDVFSYEVKLQIPKLESIDLPAVTKISFTAVNEISVLKLHAQKTAIVPIRVSMNGSSLKFEFLGDYVLAIDLPAKLSSGDKAELQIEYKITAAQLDNGRRRGLFFDPASKLFAVEDWPYFTRTWIPSNDNPADPAIFSIEAEIPKGVTVASNGLKVKQEAKGDRDVIGWKINQPITTYGVNLVIGNIGMQERDFCYSSDKVNNSELPCSETTQKLPLQLYNGQNGDWDSVQYAVAAIAFFSSVLGPYPYEKIGFVQAPQHFAMEYPTLITKVGSTNVHELAHSWFGNSVMIEHWGDFWISEGFATYLDFLYAEFKYNRPFQYPQSPIAPPFNFTEETDVYSIFDNKIYFNGASAVHALRNLVANSCSLPLRSPKETKLHYSVLRNIYQAHAGKHLGTESLVSYLKQNLHSVLAQNGCGTSKDAIITDLQSWATKWFR